MYIEMESLEEMMRLLDSVKENLEEEEEELKGSETKKPEIQLWIFVKRVFESFETGNQRFNLIITAEDPTEEGERIIFYSELGKIHPNPDLFNKEDPNSKFIYEKYKAEADKENNLIELRREEIIKKLIEKGYLVFLGRCIGK